MKVIVLLSGGLDSCVVLADALLQGHEVVAINFDYGQTHRGPEIYAAKAIAQHYGVPHRIVGMASVTLPSALTGSLEIPTTHADAPDATIVPGRNLMLISIAAAIAQSEGAGQVLLGANEEDAAGYPDCRPGFVHAASLAVQQSTEGRVFVMAPFITWPKSDIVRWGWHIGAPLELSWSCYRGGSEPCNNCGACISRNEAVNSVSSQRGLLDPSGRGVLER